MNTIFHHELKDPLSQVVYRSVPHPGSGVGVDIRYVAHEQT
jgi:hypothetical protein